ncbi:MULTISPECIES: TolC family protein [unclassified Polaromonas]|jgi:outer membrane protein TolC|uniref:TolC family protein n=1 Tax=unclassified Polaromonas TaxID=2638319 RepID=UPI000BD1C7B4|nr:MULTISPECIES: TolC family protein [unclassified Polaromonas]OYY37333.1 MAG: transporter [Polaromonas sp. 35-63-35]OYZ21646.1 MAG: transporter [Polaromonas sp. 16-63-31]OYZ77788.1 MAG: transporter [Polaromonas sp. 24-63-21]OZA45818.1 MAG: transporter [Polaromonas sp. 17-63-33]OZA87126.1 MAG: transporter [Polaromonas sp. 39-63-25]
MSISFPISRITAAAWMVAIASASWAADPLTLIEAQRIAVDRSQQLVAQEALTAAAKEQAVAAGQLPDPVLKLGIDNLPADGADRGSLTRDFMTMRRIGVMQEITRSAKRQLRSERFERDAQRVQAQRQLTLVNLQRDTALAWLDRYYTQAMRELVQQQLEETRLQIQAADIAFRAGRGSQSDVFAARSAVIQLEDRVSQIGRQSRNAGLMLARWVGTTDADRPLSGSPSWQTTSLQIGVSSEHIKQHPDLRAISAEIDTVETDARLAQANKQADWSVEASYAQRGPTYSNMISIGVSIPLQWDQKNRQNRELAAKLALVDEARARYEDMLRNHEAEVRGWLNDWQTGKDRVTRYRNELIPTARQRTEAALTSYRTGKSDLAGALAARRDELDIHMQALTLEMETARSWAQLNFLVPEHSMPAQAKEQP